MHARMQLFGGSREPEVQPEQVICVITVTCAVLHGIQLEEILKISSFVNKVNTDLLLFL